MAVDATLAIVAAAVGAAVVILVGGYVLLATGGGSSSSSFKMPKLRTKVRVEGKTYHSEKIPKKCSDCDYRTPTHRVKETGDYLCDRCHEKLFG